jgi:hypothetical protein
MIDDQSGGYSVEFAYSQWVRERVEAAVRSKVENEAAFQRIGEIKAIVKSIDFSWYKGFLRPDEYVEKRR